jgi:hypothetical protein
MSKKDPIDSYHHEAGKGARPRPVDREKFENNWDKIFGKKKETEHESTTHTRIQDPHQSQQAST